MDLFRALGRLETGDPQILSEPPPLDARQSLAPSDAWQIYVAHVAQSLWVEARRAVPWRLVEFLPEQRDCLLGSRGLFQYDAAGDRYRVDPRTVGRVTPWNPRVCYEFLSNLGMIRASQAETIYALTDWMRGHLIHMSDGEDPLNLFGYAGPPPPDKVLYPLQGRLHKTAGCWGTTGLYVAVLRSANIPVVGATIRLGDGMHSHPVFPSVNLSLPHADDVYNRVLTPSGAVVPTPDHFCTLQEMQARFLAPALDRAGDRTHTVGEQASYNAGKRHLQLAYAYMADSLLYQYADEGPRYLDDSLRGPRQGGKVQEFALPYFGAAERAAMIAAVEERLRAMGGGDLEASKAKVIQRFRQFDANR
jgi:hypothetical protein